MSDFELNELINKIKQRRQELDLSYQDLANITGISKSTLQRYETGFIKKVPITQIEIIAKALHVTPGYLMGWEENKTEIESLEDTLTDKNKEDIPVLDDPDIRMIARKSLNNDPKKIKKLKRVIEAILSDDEDDD